MNPILILIPIGVIALIFVIMLPIMKKSQQSMQQQYANNSIFVNVSAGNVSTINGKSYTNALPVYGFDTEEELNITLTPAFTIGKTHYKGNSEVVITFTPQKFHVYNVEITSKKPKDGEFIYSHELSDDALIFKSTFYLIIKDVTETKDGQLQLTYAKRGK